MSTQRVFQIGFCGLLVASALFAGAQPVAVSPGSPSGALIGHGCPTFSWGEVVGARSYELVVYRLGETSEEAQAVLREAVAGNASSWTPSLDRCLARGGAYAWSLRAIRGNGPSKWSVPSLFEVAPGPSEAEFEAALQVVRRYLDVERDAAVSADGVGKSQDTPQSRSATEASAPLPIAEAVGTTQLSVEGGIEADSFTGDGSTLTDLDPANLAGTVPVSKGGTAASAAGDARTNLGAAAAADLTTHASNATAHHVPPTSLPPSGAAGGDLAGSYPDPTVGANAVESAEIVDGSVAETDLAFDPATQAELEGAFAPGSLAAGNLVRCLDNNLGGWRYWDLGDGTVLDCNTGKIWLKDALCLGRDTWDETGGTSIFTKVADLNSGTDFGCADYTAGTYTDWRVPAVEDMCGLWDGSCTGTSCCTPLQGIVDTTVIGSPKVANAKGDGRWSTGDAFVAVSAEVYWLADEFDADTAWDVALNDGSIRHFVDKSINPNPVWPVRGGP